MRLLIASILLILVSGCATKKYLMKDCNLLVDEETKEVIKNRHFCSPVYFGK